MLANAIYQQRRTGVVGIQLLSDMPLPTEIKWPRGDVTWIPSEVLPKSFLTAIPLGGPAWRICTHRDQDEGLRFSDLFWCLWKNLHYIVRAKILWQCLRMSNTEQLRVVCRLNWQWIRRSSDGFRWLISSADSWYNSSMYFTAGMDLISLYGKTIFKEGMDAMSMLSPQKLNRILQ